MILSDLVFSKRKFSGFFFTLLIFCLLNCNRKDAACWITMQGDAAAPNQWICFQKVWDVKEKPLLEIAEIAVDSKYWLYINDTLVIRDGGITRNVNPEDTYYDEVDIAPFLKRGENEVKVLINYFGKKGANHNSSGKAGLYFNSASLKSDNSWQYAIHPAFYNLSEISNFRYAVESYGYNANENLLNWQQAQEVGPPPVAPWNQLIKRPIPLFKDYGLTDFVKITTKGDTVVAQLPYDAQFTVYFKIKGSKNQKLQLISDTYSLGKLRHHNGIKTEYTCKDGEQEFETFHWISGHQLLFVKPKDVEIISLKFRETGYNTRFEGRFETDDKLLNRLWEKCRRTLYVCTRDYYMDCPDRERTQYGGDMAHMINQSFYAFDTSINALNKKSILSVFAWQREDSTLYMPYGGIGNEELSLQMLYLTGYHGIYQYYLQTEDTTTIKTIYPGIKKYHALWQMDENGLVKQRKGDWYWTDWGSNIDERLLDNMLYADALKSDILIADILGQKEESIFYQGKYNKLKDAINRYYWTESGYRSAGFKGEVDDRGNAIAILAGVADSSKFDILHQVFKNSLFASTYMERFVLEALFQMGKSQTALNRMKLRYKEMVDAPYSTVWEQWKFVNPFVTTATYNHGWTGSPLHLLPQYVAGIQTVAPRYTKYLIKPALTELDKIYSTVPTVQGLIEVKMSFEGWQYLMEVYSPPATVAMVGVPKKYLKHILKINGSIVKNDEGRKNRPVKNASFSGEDNEYLYLTLQPGKWVIEAF